MKISRRQLAAIVPALAAAQTKDAKEKPVLASKCYVYEDLTARKTAATGNEQRAVFDGVTHTKYPLEMHITSLAAGQAPHAPHHHVHEEMIMLRNGQLDVTIAGKTTRVTAGSVVYVYSNEEHGWKNPGPDRAEYFVLAVGKEG